MDFLKELVPWIGAAATGGAPALITLAASKVTEALGYDVEPTKEAITSAIQAATPEQQIRLKEIDMNFELELKRMGYDSIEKLKAFELDNNKDARKMQMTALQQNDWFAKNFVYILADRKSVV